MSAAILRHPTFVGGHSRPVAVDLFHDIENEHPNNQNKIEVSSSTVHKRAVPNTTDAPAPKKLKASAPKKTSASQDKLYTSDEIHALSRAALEAHCMHLQQTLTSLSSPLSDPTAMSQEDLAPKLATLRKIITAQLCKALKWTPSCKRGTATFTQQFPCSAQMFLAFIGEPKMAKAKRYEAGVFQDDILMRDVSASVRYGHLYLKDNVGVRFDDEEGVLKINGKYGV